MRRRAPSSASSPWPPPRKTAENPEFFRSSAVPHARPKIPGPRVGRYNRAYSRKNFGASCVVQHREPMKKSALLIASSSLVLALFASGQANADPADLGRSPWPPVMKDAFDVDVADAPSAIAGEIVVDFKD